jgi:hypothetical protein
MSIELPSTGVRKSLSGMWRDALLVVSMIAAYFLIGIYVLPRLGIDT